MHFEFATASRIIFGAGSFRQLGSIAREKGRRALIVTGSRLEPARALENELAAQGIESILFQIWEEPTTDLVKRGVEKARENQRDLIIGFGGGSVIDAGKARSAMATNPGEVLDYLEVIAKGLSIKNPSLPYIAIPTTAGTGSEVTRNSVIASPEHHQKVSLRSPLLLPSVALIDPELTYSLPPAVTASTGLDALTQVLEPFVSIRSNPLTDPLCKEGIRLAARSLKKAYEHAEDTSARQDMSLVSLLGGLALANSGLGGVHGFAGVIGGMFHAPHGAICARLLPFVMAENVRALRERDPNSPILERYQEVARLLTGNSQASAEDGIAWVEELIKALNILPLSSYGMSQEDLPDIVDKATGASSMKANPIKLTHEELLHIIEQAV